MRKFIISIDAGTTSNRSILFDLKGKPIFSSQKEFTQYFPKSGWVEHNPDEIWRTTIKTLKDVDKKGIKIHPTQKPENLISRIIMACSNVNDIVLDPFFGTGTTGAVAKRLGRHYIGIEKNNDYIVSAKKRIEKVRSYEVNTLEISQSKKTEPRIPFGWLIERKLIEPGTILYDQRKKYQAKVRADGSVISDNNAGSIHQIGAEVQSASACNGWTFWHFDVEGELKPIDILRQQLRSELN